MGCVNSKVIEFMSLGFLFLIKMGCVITKLLGLKSPGYLKIFKMWGANNKSKLAQLYKWRMQISKKRR